ncbi:MAG: hypothetical protein H0X33_08620 [Taibaiella sp.]|nr:hypothetical protein [Taibaiella sp.]
MGKQKVRTTQAHNINTQRHCEEALRRSNLAITQEKTRHHSSNPANQGTPQAASGNRWPAALFAYFLGKQKVRTTRAHNINTQRHCEEALRRSNLAITQEKTRHHSSNPAQSGNPAGSKR